MFASSVAHCARLCHPRCTVLPHSFACDFPRFFLICPHTDTQSVRSFSCGGLAVPQPSKVPKDRVSGRELSTLV